MKLSQLAATLCLSSFVLVSTACGESKGDEKKKPAIEVIDKAPAQPTKPVKKSDAEWKKELTPEQYHILRNSGTERPYGEVYKEFKNHGGGTYYCAGCNAELFSSKEKFDSRCGWPSFYDPSKAKNVKSIMDPDGRRVEVRCNVCDGHLGHVFSGEGFDTPTDQRYCINGIALKFVPYEKEEKAEKKTDEKPEAQKDEGEDKAKDKD